MMDRSPLHLLHRAAQLAEEVFLSSIAETTPRQLAVLVSIDENEGASQQTLSDRTGIDRSTLAAIVRRLLLRNLVSRRRTEGDGRTYAVKLTSKGQRLLRRVEPLARKVDQRVLGALPENRRQEFVDLLSVISSKLGLEPADLR
jgi:MarR family transcriptional regulator, temperature-dependent positive regulator of motility